MHQPGDHVFVGRFHGQDVPLVALGDQDFLQRLGVFLAKMVQGLPEGLLGLAHLLPGVSQGGAGTVGDFPVIINAVVNALFQFRLGAPVLD